MAKATKALAGKHVIEIERALEMKADGYRPSFRCSECGGLVRPHKKGTTGQAAHFEHLSRNAQCSLSD
jgi:hypothetical protein